MRYLFIGTKILSRRAGDGLIVVDDKGSGVVCAGHKTAGTIAVDDNVLVIGHSV